METKVNSHFGHSQEKILLMLNRGTRMVPALLAIADIHLMGHQRCQGCCRNNLCFGILQVIFI